jgi:hypothetical protein
MRADELIGEISHGAKTCCNACAGSPVGNKMSKAKMSSEVGKERVSGQGWLLLVTCAAQFMVILDLSIVNVALPSIQSWMALGGSLPQLALPRAPTRVGTQGGSGNILTPTTNPVVPQPGPPQLTLTAPVFRREDMLMLVFYGYNLVLTTSGGAPALAPADARQEAYLVVQFPPQAVLEAAVPVGATPPATWPIPPLPALLAGPSQLAFLVPAATTSIPFTMDALLGWSGWAFQWESSPFAGAKPPDLATYIEAPAHAKPRWHRQLVALSGAPNLRRPYRAVADPPRVSRGRATAILTPLAGGMDARLSSCSRYRSSSEPALRSTWEWRAAACRSWRVSISPSRLRRAIQCS